MSGSYQDTSATAADMVTIAAARDAAWAATMAAQRQTLVFIQDSGADASPGHGWGDVVGPAGAAGDADLTPDASDG